MPMYMTQYVHTPEAIEHLLKTNEDRSAAIEENIKQIGERLTSLYFCLGDYHGLALYEAPDSASVLSLQLAVESEGFIKVDKTKELFTAEEAQRTLKKAKGISIKAPKN